MSANVLIPYDYLSEIPRFRLQSGYFITRPTAIQSVALTNRLKMADHHHGANERVMCSPPDEHDTLQGVGDIHHVFLTRSFGNSLSKS